MKRENHCDCCGGIIHLHETSISKGKLTFCSAECESEFEQDNLTYGVEVELPIEYDNQQLTLAI
jgi:hypothetical protein